MNKRILIFSLTMMSMICMFSSCKNQQELKISNINVTAGTFDFVDVNNGNKLSYEKLMLNEQEVVDFYCSDSFGGYVTLALDKDNIVRDGNSVSIKNGQAFTVHAVLKYKLENGVLTIFHDISPQK